MATPIITSFTPASGGVDTAVTVTGFNFKPGMTVKIHGIDAAFTVNSPTQLTATAPFGATVGRVTVSSDLGTATSAGNFTVTYPAPTITSFTPTGGSALTQVTINGTGLNYATAVTFNGTPAEFIRYTSTFLIAYVPAGATTGKIKVTTPGGEVTSVGNFTTSTLSSGIWSTTAWTGDATTGIPGTNSDANGYWDGGTHFGSTTNAVINGRVVAGSDTGFNGSDMDISKGVAFYGASNNLTALGGNGSALIGSSFWYGLDPQGVIIKGLTAGQAYRVSFFSVGWEGPGTRLADFGSGTDHLVVDQGQFGAGNGIRVDYTFTASTPTQTISIDALDSGLTWHLHAITRVRLVPRAPTATVLAPTSVTTTSATLRATVNANGTPGVVRFKCYDPFGRVPEVYANVSPAVAGYSNTSVTAAVTTLKPHTDYTCELYMGDL